MFSVKSIFRGLGSMVLAFGLLACGGGGGGSGSILYYPYEDVYGNVCSTQEASPGCTFDRATGARINVAYDRHYDRYLGGSDDLWYVQFDGGGTAAVYNEFGQFQYYTDVSSFYGWVGSTTIGVGVTGLFWEDVRNGTYWLGKNGVLYSANQFESNYGDAINDETADDATDTNFAALNSEGNKKLIKGGAEKLVKDYGFTPAKAKAVATALNAWYVSGVERGFSTTTDVDKTFRTVFGVGYGDALAAVKQYLDGDKTGMRDLSNRSAAALGLKPHQAQKYMKGMYKKALANFGYDVETVNW